jgi:hypothetical protein
MYNACRGVSIRCNTELQSGARRVSREEEEGVHSVLTFKIVGKCPHKVRLDGHALFDLEYDLIGIGAQVVDTEIVLQGVIPRELVLVGTDDPVLGAARGVESQLSERSDMRGRPSSRRRLTCRYPSHN